MKPLFITRFSTGCYIMDNVQFAGLYGKMNPTGFGLRFRVLITHLYYCLATNKKV